MHLIKSKMSAVSLAILVASAGIIIGSAIDFTDFVKREKKDASSILPSSGLSTEEFNSILSSDISNKDSKFLRNTATLFEWERSETSEAVADRSSSSSQHHHRSSSHRDVVSDDEMTSTTTPEAQFFPFIVCDVAPDKSGIRSWSHTESYFDFPSTLIPLSYKDDDENPCVFAYVPVSIAQRAPASLIVRPLSSERNIAKGLVHRIIRHDSPFSEIQVQFCPGTSTTKTNARRNLGRSIIDSLRKNSQQHAVDNDDVRVSPSRFLRAERFSIPDDMKSNLAFSTDRHAALNNDFDWNDRCDDMLERIRVFGTTAENNSFLVQFSHQGSNVVSDSSEDDSSACLLFVIAGLAIQSEICWIGTNAKEWNSNTQRMVVPPQVSLPDVTNSSSSSSLVTTFEGSHHTRGNMFDLKSKTNVIITGMTIHTKSTDTIDVILQTKKKSHVGFERESTAWIPIASVQLQGRGMHQPTPLPHGSFHPVEIKSGCVQAFYVSIVETSDMVDSTGNHVGGVAASNSDLEILVGIGEERKFDSISYGRIWNGGVEYSLAPVKHSLITTFSGESEQAGNMFDIRANDRDIVLTELDIHTLSEQPLTVQVYTLPGSYVGSETTPASWTLLTSVQVIGRGKGQPTTVVLDRSVRIVGKHTQGFYVTLLNADMLYSIGTMQVGDVAASNSDMEVLVGVANGYPFGRFFGPRVWNGEVRYWVF